MLNLQLFIEGQEVDLFDDESVTLTQSIQDVMDIEKVFTDFSRTFNVPASKTNNKIFKHFHDPNIIGFDARYKKSAELHLNYRLFKKGKIKLEGATKRDNKAHTYKLTFFGSTITLNDLLGEDKLNSLSYISEFFSFTYNNDNIKTYMSDGLDVTVGDETFEDAIVFPLITHTKRLIYNSNHTADNENSDTTNNIAYINDTSYGLEISQLKPAIKVHAIIRAIEQKYNINFTDDFFSTTNDVYNKLYLWLHNKTGAFGTGEIPVGFASNYAITTNDGYVRIKSGAFELYGAPAKAINIVAVPDTDNPFNVVIYKDGLEYRRWDDVELNYTNDTEWSLRNQNNGDIEGQVLGTYQIAIESETPNNFDFRIAVRMSRGRETRLSATASVGTDLDVISTTYMPDMKVIDFLTGLFKMFNLTAFVNDNEDVVVKTLDDFYAESTNTWDVTPYIDKDQQTVNTILPYKQLDFSYDGTDNFFAKSHEEQFKVKWGELRYNVSEKFEGSVYKIELPFEHFKFERLYDVNGGTKTDIMWGWSADIKQEASVGQPLLFYPISQTLNMGILDLNGAVSQKTSAYVPSNSVSLTDSFNINFGNEYNEFAEVPFNSTIFETYYKNYVSEIFDPQKRILKTKAYLPLSMLTEFSLADKVRIFNDLYRINKITTNFENLQSDLELINSKDTFGERISVPATIPTRFTTEDKCLTVDSMTDISELYAYTADSFCEADGFTITSTTDLIPDALDTSNNPKYTDVNQAIVVTPAKLADVDPIEVYISEIILAHTITELGLVGSVAQIDEYGFFYSTTSSDIDSLDYYLLKANSNVTNIHFETNQFNKHTSPDTVRAAVSGLSSGQTIYWTFYARTNTSPLYAFRDVFSDKKSNTTL